MKTQIRTLILTVFLLLTAALLQAQSPPHPNNGAAPTSGAGNKPVGGGASLADGSFILLALALAYAGRKWYETHKNKAENPV